MKLSFTFSKTAIISLIIYTFFILGILMPDFFWGTHYFAFLPSPLNIILLILPLPLFFINISNSGDDSSGKPGFNIKFQAIFLLASLILAVGFYNLPIQTDIYGDARDIVRNDADLVMTEYSSEWAADVFSPDIFSPKNQEKFNLGLVRLLSYISGKNIVESFSILNAACGFVYLLALFNFIFWYFRDNITRYLMILTGILTPLLLMFFGNTEIYAAALCIYSLLMMSIFAVIRSRKSFWLIISIILFIFGIKAHSAGFIFFPALLLSCLHFFKLNYLFTWKKAAGFIIIPIIALGIIAYFFILKNYNISYSVPKDMIDKHIFLPLVPSPPPLDSYTMFSVNHFSDYLNQVFYWPLGAIMLAMASLLFYRKRIRWNAPEVIISGISTILMLILFFAINPLLSMQRDWNLFLIPAPAILFFAFALTKHTEKESLFPDKSAGPLSGLALLTIPFFVVNLNSDLIPERLESTGVSIYNSYYLNSSYVINIAMQYYADDKDKYIEHYENIFSKLVPKYKGKNYDYALVASRIANFYVENAQYEKALEYYQLAEEFFPGEPVILLSTATTYYTMKEYDRALDLAIQLLDIDQYNPDYLMLAVNSSFKLQDYEAFVYFAEIYLQIYPDNDRIRQLVEEMKGETLITPPYLFSRSSNSLWPLSISHRPILMATSGVITIAA